MTDRYWKEMNEKDRKHTTHHWSTFENTQKKEQKRAAKIEAQRRAAAETKKAAPPPPPPAPPQPNARKNEMLKRLQLQTTAKREDIRHAYHKLALKYHPDKCGGSDVEFKRILEAYEYLTMLE